MSDNYDSIVRAIGELNPVSKGLLGFILLRCEDVPEWGMQRAFEEFASESGESLEANLALLQQSGLIMKVTPQVWRGGEGVFTPFYRGLRPGAEAVRLWQITERGRSASWSAARAARRDAYLSPLSGSNEHALEGLESPDSPWHQLLGYPLNEAWLEPYTSSTVAKILAHLGDERFVRLEPNDDIVRYHDRQQVLTPRTLGTIALRMGRLNAPALAGSPAATAAARFLAGETTSVLSTLDGELRDWRKDLGRRNVFWTDDLGALHLLARLADGRTTHVKRVRTDGKLAEQDSQLRSRHLWVAFQAVELLRRGLAADATAMAKRAAKGLFAPRDGTHNPYVAYLGLVLTECGIDLARHVEVIEATRDAAYASGWLTVAVVAQCALDRIGTHKPNQALQADAGVRAFVGLASEPPDESWRFQLQALVDACGVPGVRESNSRMAWIVDLRNGGLYDLTALEQKRSKSGEWSAGRTVALKRLGGPGLEYMTEQDLRMASAITYKTHYYGGSSIEFDELAFMRAAVGHPLLLTVAREPLEVVARAVVVEVVADGDHDVVRLSDDLSSPLLSESQTRVSVAEILPIHERISKVLGPGLRVPSHAREELGVALSGLVGDVRIEAEGELLVGRVTSDVDSRCRARFWRLEEQFQVELRARPLGEHGPVCIPGKGSAKLVASVKGVAVQAQRDFEEEVRLADEVVGASPTLMERDGGRDYRFYLDSLVDCLRVLGDLQRLGDDVVVEWAKGTEIPAPQRFGTSDVRISIRAASEWFEADAELRINEDQVLDLSDLLALMKNQPGEFLELTSGEVLELTVDLRRRLQTLEMLAKRRRGASKGKAIQIPQSAALAVWDAVQPMSGSGRARKLSELAASFAQTSDGLREPTRFAGELRPYQQQGYDWLARFSDLGFGACLADEMGLGKTIQALALLGEDSHNGPAVIVAPTSVCANWIAEARRFAPHLVFPALAAPAERPAQIAGLGAGDVLVISYTMLVLLQAELAAVSWNVVLLDEAHAIKNRETARSKSARKLNARFRLALTGTPVENHVGELWSLMDFLNPGLLGGYKAFMDRFGPTVDVVDAARRRGVLRKLVQPFILRRRKADVFSELPPRQDVAVRVELGPEQAALYEATRRRALAALTASDENTRLEVLAGLMKLRQAACDPRLVLPDSDVTGAKIERLIELVGEIVEGNNRALVFSQFTSFLALAKTALDAAGVRYEYLDGSTPAGERAAIVERFQTGDAPLFLISLRAGGTGLNLTASNYVIHLDPWWNPAVEDQASDRAHRIGQERKVTVYRLIAANTIEERILALHDSKRQVAKDILAGADTASRLGVDELIDLLRD